MSETTRREFLKTSGTVLGAAAVGSTAPRMVFGQHADAKGPDVPTLIAVYLRGGADPLQTIVPFGDPAYYELRPTIGIQPAENKGEKGVLKLNNYFGLHPAMEPLFEMFQGGMVAPIVNVGSPHDTRSHFDAQDFMERAAPGVKSVNEGWLNRFLGMTSKGKDSELRALAFQMLLPRSLRGQYPVLAVPDNDAEYLLNTFERMYACDENQLLEQQKAAAAGKGQPVPRTARRQANGAPEKPTMTRDDTNKTIVMAGANEVRRLRELKAVVAEGDQGVGYPESRFGKQMRDIATVIKAKRGLEVAAIDYEGWDHHAYQGGATGTMANMLGDVSKVIKAFNDDLGAERMKKTLILVMSEFGRTAKENGSHGTDHGHGGFMLAVGGMIKAKNVWGQWTGLTMENLYEKRDMPVTTDFRMVFAESLEMLFGFDTMKSRIFPDWTPKGRALGFLNRVQQA